MVLLLMHNKFFINKKKKKFIIWVCILTPREKLLDKVKKFTNDRTILATQLEWFCFEYSEIFLFVFSEKEKVDKLVCYC